MAPRRTTVAARDAGEATRVGLEWLVRVRWLTALAQVGAIVAGASGSRSGTAIGWLALPVLVTLGTNLHLRRRLRAAAEPPPVLLGAVLVLDTIVLTALLAMAGGASNPFTVLYMLQVTLAAVVLGPRWTGGILLSSVGSFALLFALPGPGHSHHHHAASSAGFDAHLYGMLVAFSTTAALVSYLVTRISSALAQRERELDAARMRAERTERLVSLSTLAAGAAHELGTPLGTIAIAARELERSLEGRSGLEPLHRDAALIRAEVARCRGILEQMAARAGEAAAEVPGPAELDALIEDLRGRLSEPHRARLQTELHPDVGRPVIPARAVSQALANLVANAAEASGDDAPVLLRVQRAGSQVRFVVEDHGIGMDAAIAAHVGEPFFSTKETGQGLGVFLVQSLAERLGGQLRIDSSPGRGTTAALELPA